MMVNYHADINTFVNNCKHKISGNITKQNKKKEKENSEKAVRFQHFQCKFKEMDCIITV